MQNKRKQKETAVKKKKFILIKISKTIKIGPYYNILAKKFMDELLQSWQLQHERKLGENLRKINCPLKSSETKILMPQTENNLI